MQSWKTKRILFVAALIFFTATLSAGTWLYRYSQAQNFPPPPSLGRQSARPIGILVLAGPASTAPPPAQSTSPAAETSQPTSIHFSSPNPMEQFRDDTKKALIQKLSSTYPDLPKYLTAEQARSADPGYQRFLMDFLDKAENAQPEEKAAMLLAADFLADQLFCPSEDESKGQCNEMRAEFAQHKLTLAYDELGGGSFYKHDLLWRLWQDYPQTDAGQRAFVLLLDFGWDTSGTCAKGADQFRQVIQQGESFLQQQPDTPWRAFVAHLVGQAYTTWWTLSRPPLSGMEDYVSPQPYQNGAEDARLKAIGYFEQVQQLAPGTPLGEYARQILPTLREQQVIEDGYRFFCVYD